MPREFRLRKLLAQHLESRGNNFSALEKAIGDAHDRALDRRVGSHKSPVDRRKLKEILEPGRDVALHLTHLEALDDFLSEHHQGLAFLPIFERSGLLTSLVARRHVHILVGARETGSTLSVSHFDTQAHADLDRHLHSRGKSASSELHIVLLRTSIEEARAMSDESLQRTVLHGGAVVSIASPVANHATDWMLGKMLSRPPFGQPGKSQKEPELALVLAEPHLSTAVSSFVEGPKQIEKRHPEVAKLIHGRRWALRVEDAIYLADPEEGQNARTYGVIVAQRRANEDIWVVAAGLHGAGTHAAALAIQETNIHLPAGRPGEDGPVQVCVVEAFVSYITSSSGTQIRRVADHNILKPTRTFYPRRSGTDGAAGPF